MTKPHWPLVGVLAMALSGPVYAFSGVYAFGDSLSDNGNIYRATGGQFPPAPYYQGRFSNGPVMAEYLAKDLNVPLYDDAWGGATTGTTNNLNGSYGLSGLPGLTQEINQATTGPVDPRALYTIWAGANDYLDYLANPSAYPGGTSHVLSTSMTNLSDAVDTLAQHGARNILVINMPNLGLTPELSGTKSGAATLYSQEFNQSLNATLNNLQGTTGPGTTLYRFDAYDAMAQIFANAAAYGFSNTTSPCFDASTYSLCSTSPSVQNTYAFWDGLHPTTHLHELMASDVMAAVPEAPLPALFLVGLALIAWKMRRRRRTIVPA